MQSCSPRTYGVRVRVDAAGVTDGGSPMRRPLARPALAAACLAALSIRVSPALAKDAPATARAVSSDPADAQAAIADLRAKGPAGLAELLAAHEGALAKLDPASDSGRRLTA